MQNQTLIVESSGTDKWGHLVWKTIHQEAYIINIMDEVTNILEGVLGWNMMYDRQILELIRLYVYRQVDGIIEDDLEDKVYNIYEDVKEEEVNVVMFHSGCSQQLAIDFIKKHNGNIVDSILDLCNTIPTD